MGLQAHTVADPRTVVIHLHHADSAHRAVVGSWRLHFITPLTETELVEVVDVVEGLTLTQVLVVIQVHVLTASLYLFAFVVKISLLAKFDFYLDYRISLNQLLSQTARIFILDASHHYLVHGATVNVQNACKILCFERSRGPVGH